MFEKTSRGFQSNLPVSHEQKGKTHFYLLIFEGPVCKIFKAPIDINGDFLRGLTCVWVVLFKKGYLDKNLFPTGK